MKLTVLIDNNTYIDQYLLGEPALSFFIEDNGKKILFDAGYSEAFICNAEKLEIDLLDLDYIVISHGHLDHTWGLDHLAALFKKHKTKKRPTIIAHPLAFKSKVHKHEGNIGSRLTEQNLSTVFNVSLSDNPIWLTKNIVFLAQIPRRFAFECTRPTGRMKAGRQFIPDVLNDDTALAYRGKSALTIITGCSHSGICNITEYAKTICKTNKVACIIGGLHLLKPDSKQLTGTVKYLKNLDMNELFACHCTDLNSKIALSKAINLKEVGAGLKISCK